MEPNKRPPALESRGSYILHLKRRGDMLLFVLQNLRTGERQEFHSWEGLQHHLADRMASGLR
ncbi:hypothetical protein [Deinococcus cellulosilyticus]|uniref:Uncharacterized protein n=1 Tax=Deinococcus cellulosilyticus (strain DSM 18568 / NBRC 106333 / KACC 11606 / 5516J-15) TaxID=1223518 RepID=A0A511N0P3_DEIC1|nr:hypothetical protein [Deinococcus cellulosilyticus]GEM46432.1 hypothetical protein DC3_20670 [Deinococcus cellulosilyticus NBRC 106333 = KACC 11606]